ncbi:MAG: MFS transporter [Alphaproteobacteria bacterium]|nr:MFS transporter [Alphaproteobacteria bacterium]
MKRFNPLLADWHGVLKDGWRGPQILLLLFAAALPLAFESWSVLLNNFAIEKAQFTGFEIGVLQGIREIPGFLAFTVVFALLVWKQQTFAVLSLMVMGFGVAITGFFPTILGLYVTTFIMSTGFHYLSTMEQSLAMQWSAKTELPMVLGRMAAAASFASLITYGLVWVAAELLHMSYLWIFLIGGSLTMAVGLIAWKGFPEFRATEFQTMKILLRKRYGLYYALEFLSGARRQIFMVFAAFMMVEKFHYGVADITLLFLANCVVSIWIAPKVGRLIVRWGERPALLLEYGGLVFVFAAYAFVETAWVAAGLYIVDHMFFALAIALRSYFRKIADPKEIASTTGVSFTINHIAAVGLPPLLGGLWLVSPAAVFLLGSALAAASFVISLLVPREPAPGNETVWWKSRAAPAPVAAE